MKLLRQKLLVATLPLFLASCTSSPPFQGAEMTLPSSWSSSNTLDLSKVPLVSVSSTEKIDHLWWTHFDDDVLNTLIQQAVTNNNNLKIAMAKTAEARAGRLSSYSQLMPQINANAGAQRGNQGAATFDKTVNQTDIGLQASWEIDLFGGNQARVSEASAILESQEASQQAVHVALLSEVARNYFDFRSYQEQIAIAERNIELQKKTLNIVQVQVKEKVASDLDLQRAGAQLATAEAELPNLKTALSASRNRLQVLVGEIPGTDWQLIASQRALKPLDHKLVIAAPASVIAERPDIRAAERRLASSAASVKAATTDLFPKISLTSFFGAQTLTPESFTPWGVGINLVQPLLNFGKLQSQIDIKNAQQEQAFHAYQQTILEAVENMENALAAYINETSRNASLREAYEKSSKAEKIARIQYQEGQTGLLDLLLVQQNALAAESALARSDTALRNYLVAIYTAAGGGWHG